MKIANPLLSFLIFVSAACFAESNQAIFGLEFGKDIKLPECELVNSASPGAKFYEATAKKMCIQDAHKLQGYGLPVREINFPVADCPLIVKNFRAFPLEVDGNMVGMHFLTYGYGAQDAVFAELTKKYGKPKTISKRPLQNVFGASMQSIESTWDTGGLQVTFHGVTVNADTGEVFVDLPVAADIRKVWSDTEAAKHRSL